MERDKELLLPVEASDSDDIVEEFKLPPPRTRRPKARRALAEAHIASSNPSLMSWKCCLMFILVSIFISGVLVLSFFMLSMQSEINKLTQKVAEANVQIRQHASIEISTKKLMEKLEQYKQKFSKQDLNIKLLVHQIVNLNKTMKKLSSSNEYEHRLLTLTRDVDHMKSGMASTGANIDKIQYEIIQHGDKFDSILTELKNVKMAIYNSSTKNKTMLEKLTRPISAQTQEIRKLKGIIRYVNSTQNRNIRRIVTKIYNNQVDTDENIKQLKSMIRSVNTTHIDDSFKLVTFLSNYRNKSESDLDSYAHGVSVVMNVSHNIQKKMEHYDKLLKNYTKLENDVKLCDVLSSVNQQNIQLMEGKLAKYRELMEKGENTSVAYVNEIMHLHGQLQEFADKFNSSRSDVGPTLSLVSVISRQPEQTTIKPESTTIKPESTLHEQTTTIKPETTIKYSKVSIPVERTAKEGECPLSCEKGEQCIETNTEYKCVCKQGYVKVGKYCEDVNECLSQDNNCHVNASCTNIYGSYVCACNDGFQGNGTHCKAKKDIVTCTLPHETGLCRAYFPKFFFNSTSRRCEKFIYGGCGGNANNFETIDECTIACGSGSFLEAMNTSASNVSLVSLSATNVTVNISKSSVTTNETYLSTTNSTAKVEVDVNSTKDSNITGSASVVSSAASSSLAIKNEDNMLIGRNSTTTVTPDSSIVSKDNSQGNLLGTVKPEQATTFASDSDAYMTPEMPDESGLYGTDQTRIDDQTAKKETEEDYRSFKNTPNKGSGRNIDGINADFLDKKLDTNNDRDDQDADLNDVDV